jgi:plastocyanin
VKAFIRTISPVPLIMKTRKVLLFNLTRTLKLSSLVLLLSALSSGSPAWAAEFTVVMTADDQFNPSYLEIEVDDGVTWENQDHFKYHSSYSTDNLWSSPDLAYGQTFRNEFWFPGTYPYVDYYIGGMTGTIVVRPHVQRAMLIDPMQLQDGRFRFTLSNLTVGATYVVQGSTNLADWTSLATNVAASAVETWTDNGAAAFGRRFYRCWQSP